MTEPSYPSSPQPGPMRPPGRYQGIFWFALLVSVAGVLGGTSIVIGAYQAAADPATVVRAYFSALQDGDAPGALGFGTVPDGHHELLTSDVLAAQNATAPMENVVVLAVHRNGNRAVVDVAYTLGLTSGRTTVRDAVPVSRHGNDWRLDRSAIPVTITPGDGSTLATFAGAAVPNGDYAMFPGAVPVTYSTPNLAADPVSQVMRFIDPGSLEVNAVVSPAGRKLITPALRAALVDCLGGKGNPQALCPVPGRELAVPGSLRGNVTGKTAGLVLLVNSTTGKIDISGETDVHGTYQKLDDNDIATSTSTSTVDVHAHCFATVPGTIIWDVS